MHALDRWREEKRSAYLCRIISDQESGTPRQLLFLELAKEADSQAELWAQELKKSNQSVPESYRPDLLARILARLVRLLGPYRTRFLLAAFSIRGLSVYQGRHPENQMMPATLVGTSPGHDTHVVSSNSLAVALGFNDGLVSITCVVVGVAGAAGEPGVILLAGVAGLLAGAFTMATGEYLSVRSQREIIPNRLDLEHGILPPYLTKEVAELEHIYQSRGMGKAEARAFAMQMISDPEMGLETVMREEHGSIAKTPPLPWVAALSSFFAFICGGVIPLVPYLLELQHRPLLASIALSGVALFCTGCTLCLLTGRNVVLGSMRVMLIGAIAGVLAYWAGKLIGTFIL